MTVSPITDNAYSNWLWFDTFVLAYEEYVTDVIDCPQAIAHRSMIDGKAMRRMKSEDEIQLVMQQSTIGGAASVNMAGAIRFLQQLN